MRSFGVASLAVVALATQLGAQELGVYGTVATPGAFRDETFGAGASLAGYMRLGAIFSDSVALSRSQLRVGLRVAYSQFRSSEHRDWECSWTGPCTYNPHTARSRMGIVQATLLLLPYRTSSTRVELGGGVASYMLDEFTDHYGFTANAGASRRLIANRPWWATLEFVVHGQAVGPMIVDGPRPAIPGHSLWVGVSYRLRTD